MHILTLDITLDLVISSCVVRSGTRCTQDRITDFVLIPLFSGLWSLCLLEHSSFVFRSWSMCMMSI